MNIHRFQGWALIFSAVIYVLIAIVAHNRILLYQFLWMDIIKLIDPIIDSTINILSTIHYLLLIFGLPALIYAIQPQSNRWGKLGLILMAIPIADSLLLDFLWILPNQNVYDNTLNWFYEARFAFETMFATCGITYFGYLLIGWLTARGRIFPSWVGYSLLINGVLLGIIKFVQFSPSIWTSTIEGHALMMPNWINPLSTFSTLIGAVALIGYGWYIIRYKTDLYDGHQINKLQEKGDTKSLIKILEKEHQSDMLFRLSVAGALAKIGNEQGINYLISKLQTSDVDEKESAKEILDELNVEYNLPTGISTPPSATN